MEYRLYEKNDEKKIVSLLDHVFEGWPKFDLPVPPLDYWKWKFLDNPYGSLIALSCDNGKIFGCQHILLKKIKVGKKEYRSGIGVDVAIHPDYRGKGEYGRLSKFKKTQEKTLDMKFRNHLQSNPNLIKRDRKKGNPLFPHNVYNTIKVNNVDKFFSGSDQTIKWGYLSLSTVNRVYNFLTPNKHTKQVNVEVKEIERFDERIDDFWLRIKDGFKFIIVRDREYLNWRYCDPRGGKFKVFLAESDGVVFGYMVLRVNRDLEGSPVGYLVDLLVDSSIGGNISPLIERMEDFFKENEVTGIHYRNVNNMITKHLGKTGFIRKPKKLNLTFHKESLVKDDYSVLLSSKLDDVHFVYGDHDHI